MDTERDFTEKMLAVQAELFAWIAASLSPHCDLAEDAMQEVNLRLVKNADRYNPLRPFRPWAWTVARNVLANWRKSHARRKVFFDGELADAFAARLVEEQRSIPDGDGAILRLAECRRALPEDQRRLLSLRYDDELPLKEIAKKIAKDEGYVKGTLAHIRRKLHACIMRKCAVGKALPEGGRFDALEDAFVDSLLTYRKTHAPKRKRRRRLWLVALAPFAAAAAVTLLLPKKTSVPEVQHTPVNIETQQEPDMNTTTLIATGAIAAASVLPATTATESTTAHSRSTATLGILDARLGDAAESAAVVLETRTQTSHSSQKFILDTATPTGIVIMLI